MTHECGSSDPTLARFGNSCGETTGSRAVESSEWDCAVLDDSDDDTRVLWKVDKWNSSGKAWSKWSLVRAYDVAVHQQLSGAEISTDVCSCMSS